MSQLTADYSTTIAASAATVYGILADYEHAHRKILPPETFLSLDVTKGGQGAGTEVDVRTRILGKIQTMHMIVSVPEAGRMIVETDTRTGFATTFTITPTSDSTCSVDIRTKWTAQSGLIGLVESVLAPSALRRIYRRELALLQKVVETV